MLKKGERVGDWIVDSTLGEGGMGAVYRVHSALTPRLVAALKVLKPSADSEARARFVREAEALSALRHPAIVHVMGFSEDERRGLLYIVMEVAQGETLKARMDRGPMGLDECVRVFTRLASALEHAHAAGVYHRDLKPANVILCDDGSVRLVDFGIAATQTAEPLTSGGHLGTVSYVPPEVFKGDRVDSAAADVYSFGLVLHEALVGKRMFTVQPGLTPAAAAASVGTRKLAQQPFDPGDAVPERVRDVIRRATHPNPVERPDMTTVRKTLVSLRERRGQVDAAERTPVPGSVPRPYVPVAVAEDHTARVPEPARPAEDEGALVDRVRHRPARPRFNPVLAGGGALLLLGGIALGLSHSSASSERPAKVEASETARPEVTPVQPTGPRLVMPTPMPARNAVPPAVVTPVPPTPAPGKAPATPLPAAMPPPETSERPPVPAVTPGPVAAPTAAPERRRPTPVPTAEPPEDEAAIEGVYKPPPGSEDESSDEPEPEPEPTPPAPRR